MHVYSNGGWVEGQLDEALIDGHHRVSVHRQLALVPVTDQFFVRGSQLAMLAGYVRRLGFRRVVRKVVSRRSESVRNDAWLSVGLGTLTDDSGRRVLFVSTNGPRAAERVVVPDVLVLDAPDGAFDGAPAGYAEAAASDPWVGLAPAAVTELEALVGWRPERGTRPALSASTVDGIGNALREGGATQRPLGPPPPPTPVRERHVPAGTGAAATGPEADRPPFHCFGYGQYAKTQVIPNLGRRLVLVAIHEVNPSQLGPVPAGAGPVWDTSGRPRPDEEIVNAVLAGYHHTHAPLAVELLDGGARHVIIEKPIATTEDQVAALVDAMARNPDAKVHVAFQRRYSPFNALIRSDLGPGPVSMAATVYEVPLPALHWYRWPIVGNAIVSNGCHWIDHFLFLNDFADVARLDATRWSTQIAIGIELVNGASATISLRHEGAPRLGVRDSVTLWQDDATVVLTDLQVYEAERGFRRLRRRTSHPYRSLEAMYDEFGRRIAEDLPGDSIESVRTSALTTLALARRLDTAAQ